MKLNYNYKEDKCDYGRCDYEKDYDEHKKYDYDDRKYDHKDKCCDDHKFAHCCPKSPCPYPILFECTQGTGTEITQTRFDGANNFTPRSLGCLTIDTSCLKMPVVKFDFCSIIKFRSDGDQNNPVRLVFQLCKQCDDGNEICCGTWDYVAAFATQREQLTTSFCFSHCECNSCPGCCTYTVKLIEAVNNDPDNILIVSSPTLQAFAKSSC